MSAYREGTHVALSYELERADIARSYREAAGWGAVIALVPVVAAVDVLLCSSLGVSAGSAVGACLTTLVGRFVYRTYTRGPRFAERQWEQLKDQRVEITEDAFEIHDETGGQRLAWELLFAWRETEHDFWLYLSPRRFHVIPKRVISDDALITTLRRIFADRIPETGAAHVARAKRTQWVPFVTWLGTLVVVVAGLIELVTFAVRHLLFG